MSGAAQANIFLKPIPELEKRRDDHGDATSVSFAFVRKIA
jgi:hypothetical protein